MYYWAELYSRQLGTGEQFEVLRPAISICFLNHRMFPARDPCHSVFGLLERDEQLCLTQHLDIHLLELPKFGSKVEALEEPLDFWLYFFQNGEELDADALPAPLARPEISEAMEVLKVFTQSDVERDRYENRLKALRDQRGFERQREDAIRARDEAVQARDEAVQARDEVVQAHDEAVRQRNETIEKLDQTERQLADAQGDIKRELVKRIQLVQRLLGYSRTAKDQLVKEPLDRLRTLARQLEEQLSGD
ncbi:MAG: Rpn family recombination-promoting nuclease/putative transposase [Pirellulaceae bacterium]